LTILDNILTDGELARVKKESGLPHPKDCEGGSETAWCADYRISPQPAESHKNDAENGQFCTFFGLKITENAVFSLKSILKKV
jgi:hypothetical protein